jgi:hypothetical protein
MIDKSRLKQSCEGLMKIGKPSVVINGIQQDVEHVVVSPEIESLIGSIVSGPPRFPSFPSGGKETRAASGSTAPATPAATAPLQLAPTLNDAEIDSMLQHAKIAFPRQSLNPVTSAGDMALEPVKAVLDTFPPGADAPVAFDGLGALVGCVNLAQGQPDSDSRGRKVLFYSSNIVDIAIFASDVFPGLHSVGRPLTILAVALKAAQGALNGKQEIHTFSLTPRPGTLGTGATTA